MDTSANTVDDTIYLDSTPGTGWHQLLWTVDRDSATGITLYLDGVAQADTGNPTAAQGAIDSAGTFYVARRETNRYLAMDLALVAGGTGLPSSAAVGALWAVI